MLIAQHSYLRHLRLFDKHDTKHDHLLYQGNRLGLRLHWRWVRPFARFTWSYNLLRCLQKERKMWSQKSHLIFSHRLHHHHPNEIFFLTSFHFFYYYVFCSIKHYWKFLWHNSNDVNSQHPDWSLIEYFLICCFYKNALSLVLQIYLIFYQQIVRYLGVKLSSFIYEIQITWMNYFVFDCLDYDFCFWISFGNFASK